MRLCGACGSSISALLLCALFAAGCAPRFARQDDAAEKIQFAAVAIVRSSAAPARKTRLVWTRYQDGGAPPRDAADIKTPFGTTQARLEIDAAGMRILVGGREADVAAAAPDLRQWLAILPPPHSVGYWLAGESDPAYSAREVMAADAPGIARVYQHDWEVEYAARDDRGRPSRIVMRPREAPPNLPDAEAEVRISKWLIE